MGKISRKEFIKNSQISTETAYSHVKFIEHMKKLNKYMLAEIETLQDRVTELEAKAGMPVPVKTDPEVTETPVLKTPEINVASEYS